MTIYVIITRLYSLIDLLPFKFFGGRGNSRLPGMHCAADAGARVCAGLARDKRTVYERLRVPPALSLCPTSSC